ncbi:MAG: hypothetical protein LUG85_05150 [Clostridiales bacterium]|nr:hypothetical protein [Clostridiales bacterium]MCD7827904.1 hypothetical protein [Clostridiales bacterium]
MKKLNSITPIPKAHQIIWWVCRGLLLVFAIYGMLNNSVTMFLMGLVCIAFSHLWDMFQMFGGKSFITRVNYFSQTLLNIFMVYSCAVYLLNVRTNIHFLDVVSHSFSGFIAAWYGYDLAVVMQGKKRHLSPALASLFGFTFSLFIAVGWELYEFTMDRVYGYMLQTSDIISETGLVDTMEDFICCAVGSLVGMFAVAFYRNGIIGGKNRKKIRAEVVARSKQDRKEELEFLGLPPD